MLTTLLVVAMLAATTDDVASDHLERGNAFIAEEDYISAESVFRTALESDPENPIYRSQLALCLIYQQKHAEADVELRRVLTSYPNDIAASWYGAINRYEEGEYREAAARFETVLPLLDHDSGQYFAAHWFIGNSLQHVLRDPIRASQLSEGIDSLGLTRAEVDRMVEAYSVYLELQPNAPDKKEVKQFLQWVKTNRPPPNVERWTAPRGIE